MLRKVTIKIALAGAALALLTGYATAQLPMGMSFKNQPKQLTPEERARQKALDEAYQAANKKIPDKQVANDPWSGVRPNPQAAKGNK
ncbi:MAG: hypothetical protein ACRECV_15325 [Xanthobacteraceae bacterium]